MDHNDNRCRVVSRNGRVASVHGNTADIQIVQTSACASCRLKGICSPGESSAKTIRVHHSGGLVKDMSVRLDMAERYGWLSVVFAFVLPLVIVVGILFGFRNAFGSEEVAALAGIGALVPYYGVLYLTRNYFTKLIHFDAIPLSPLHKEGVQ